jgi:DNA-binding response OmpR family regulator
MKSTPMRILIVDDSQDTARMMRVLLKGKGYETRTAFDGSESLEQARKFRPDVVLLDLNLPDMSGTDVAEELRETEGFEETAIVAISGRGADNLSPAFDGHFLKPLDHDALDAFLSRSRNKANKRRDPEPVFPQSVAV